MTIIGGRHVRSGIVEVSARLAALDGTAGTRVHQIAELDRALSDAEKVLAANEHGVAARAAEIERGIAGLNTRLDQVAQVQRNGARIEDDDSARFDKRITLLEQTSARLADKIALDVPDDKDELWRQANELLTTGDPDKGRRYCELFVERFPQDPRASQAYLAIGLSYAKETRYANAAASYRRLLANYPTAPEAPEAMWQLSRTFLQMSFCSDAKALLRNLITRYPRSRPALDASKELDSLKHPSAACVS